MADLYDLLAPYLDSHDGHDARDPAYLARLTTLPLAALTSSEPQSLAHSATAATRALQALSRRSHKPVVAAADRLDSLRDALPQLGTHAAAVHARLPALESAATAFATKYSRSSASDNALVDRRRKAMLLARNMDRVSDVLDLPSLLSSAIASSTPHANYAAALDLSAHIKRLHSLYPHSPLVASLAAQAELEMQSMTSNLIATLQSPALKLAAAMRTIGWLRRVAPDLDQSWSSTQAIGSGEGSLGALFLVCRLSCLETTLAALSPLRDLADTETNTHTRPPHPSSHTRPSHPSSHTASSWGPTHQTEKYLKKYLEIFREQTFAMIQMYKSIFPSALPAPDTAPAVQPLEPSSNPLHPLPSPLATFTPHITATLFTTLRTYLPHITDRSARDSLLTQVLYCAASLGRLGADFSLMLALLEEDDQEEDDEEEVDKDHGIEEWVQITKKHRVQASRLELLAQGVGRKV